MRDYANITYPTNVYTMIQENEPNDNLRSALQALTVPADASETVDSILSTLGGDEEKYMRAQYIEKMPAKEMAKLFSDKQIEPLRESVIKKLTTMEYLELLVMGLEQYNKTPPPKKSSTQVRENEIKQYIWSQIPIRALQHVGKLRPMLFRQLEEDGLMTLSDVAQVSLQDLLSMYGIGKTTVFSMLELLEQNYGIVLRNEDEQEESDCPPLQEEDIYTRVLKLFQSNNTNWEESLCRMQENGLARSQDLWKYTYIRQLQGNGGLQQTHIEELEKWGRITLEDMVNTTEHDLLQMEKFTRNTVAVIRGKLKYYGVALQKGKQARLCKFNTKISENDTAFLGRKVLELLMDRADNIASDISGPFADDTYSLPQVRAIVKYILENVSDLEMPGDAQTTFHDVEDKQPAPDAQNGQNGVKALPSVDFRTKDGMNATISTAVSGMKSNEKAVDIVLHEETVSAEIAKSYMSQLEEIQRGEFPQNLYNAIFILTDEKVTKEWDKTDVPLPWEPEKLLDDAFYGITKNEEMVLRYMFQYYLPPKEIALRERIGQDVIEATCQDALLKLVNGDLRKLLEVGHIRLENLAYRDTKGESECT